MRCGFCDGDLLIAIQGKDRFEMGSAFHLLVDRRKVEAIAADINSVIKLIDAFLAA